MITLCSKYNVTRNHTMLVQHMPLPLTFSLEVSRAITCVKFVQICLWAKGHGDVNFDIFGTVSECIGVLRHMQRYFSYICDGT